MSPAALDYHATQLTGTRCAPYNCAAGSGAMGLAAGSAGRIRLSADDFREEAGVSCVPGENSPSGGLFISDVSRVFARRGIAIDYGVTDAGYTRWAPAMLAAKLGLGFGAVLLGDYDALPSQYRASATFRGDHSTWVHDFDPADQSVCWHDPLRSSRIRIPISAAISYWQKPTSPIRGFAGFVKVVPPPPDTGTEVPMLSPGDDFNYGWESWTLDGTRTVYCIGGPRKPDGSTDSTMRLCAAGPNSAVLTVVSRSRLSNGKPVADSDELYAALTAGRLTTPDCGDAVAAELERAADRAHDAVLAR